LSDILEDRVPEKYFLSERYLRALLEHAERHRRRGHGFGLRVLCAPGGAGGSGT
jgi:hypothetical protein